MAFTEEQLGGMSDEDLTKGLNGSPDFNDKQAFSDEINRRRIANGDQPQSNGLPTVNTNNLMGNLAGADPSQQDTVDHRTPAQRDADYQKTADFASRANHASSGFGDPNAAPQGGGNPGMDPNLLDALKAPRRSSQSSVSNPLVPLGADYDQAVADRKEALKAQGEAAGKQAILSSERQQKAISEQEQANAEYDAKTAAIAEKDRLTREQEQRELEQATKERDEWLDKKVDRNRVWNNLNTGEKIGAGIFMALGAVGAAYQGEKGRNLALENFQKIIDKDMELQRDEIERGVKKGEYKRGDAKDKANLALQSSADLKIAEAGKWQRLSELIDARRNSLTTEEGKARADELSADARNRSDALVQDAAATRTQLGGHKTNTTQTETGLNTAALKYLQDKQEKEDAKFIPGSKLLGTKPGYAKDEASAKKIKEANAAAEELLSSMKEQNTARQDVWGATRGLNVTTDQTLYQDARNRTKAAARTFTKSGANLSESEMPMLGAYNDDSIDLDKSNRMYEQSVSAVRNQAKAVANTYGITYQKQ